MSQIRMPVNDPASLHIIAGTLPARPCAACAQHSGGDELMEAMRACPNCASVVAIWPDWLPTFGQYRTAHPEGFGDDNSPERTEYMTRFWGWHSPELPPE